MSFIAAKCPQCGGDLQLDNDKDTAFCMHCGSKIIVQEAIRKVQVDNTHMLEFWMKMANSAANAGNYEESYEYYTKVVENDLNNWKATFLKGIAAGWLSKFSNPRFNEIIQAISDAQKIIYRLGLTN